MKILKFNESESKKVDIEHLNNCFIDFIDKGSDGFKRASKDSLSINIKLNLKKRSRSASTEVDIIISEIDIIRQNLLEIKECIEKVKIEYPDTDVQLFTNNNKYTDYIVVVYERNIIVYNGKKQVVDIPFPKDWNVE